MPKINRYVDISTVDKEAKKDYIDRHSPFIHCKNQGKKGEKLSVKVRVGNEYKHPDDNDHYISYVQLWDGETFLGQTNFPPGVLGGLPGQVEVDFNIVPIKNKLNLVAISYCTKHGIWEGNSFEVNVVE
ncbi:MAG: class II SORL domain-containing protein [Spirochaetota bacterium]|nr:class II SORL domain-containing protein [Spirochaetota bacterium]